MVIQIHVKFAQHRELERAFLLFKYDTDFVNHLKLQFNASWSKTHNSFYISSDRQQLKKLWSYGKLQNISILFLNNPSVIIPTATNEVAYIHKPQSEPSIYIKQQIKTYQYQLQSRRYSNSTIATYTDALGVFLNYFSDKKIEDITNTDIVEFNNLYIINNKFSASYQNQFVNALKTFYSKVANKQIDLEKIHRPKREKLLPNVLSKQEVKKLLNTPNNIKHKAMLSLIYACGLRCGELLNLKPEHVDAQRHVLIIKQGKGRKDRIAPLSKKIIELLRAYYPIHNPKTYLFEGQTKGQQYDARSLQQVIKQTIIKAGILKPVTLHWLRHSYATHLLESGTDLRYIQEILGHSSSRTTEIYTHVSNKNIQNIVSPFDTL